MVGATSGTLFLRDGWYFGFVLKFARFPSLSQTRSQSQCQHSKH